MTPLKGDAERPFVANEARTVAQWSGLAAGAAAFALIAALPAPETLSREAMTVAALASLMIIWWVSEAVPIAATALLPMIVLPLAGVSSLKESAASYMSPIVVLLMAGFIIAKAIEKWRLHERIALNIVDRVGARPPALLAGFMIAAALLSMWISNTATALMMTPIALSVARAITAERSEHGARFRTALLLAVAYACSIGGLATPVGSPTNLIVIGYLAEQGIDLSFADWMRLGLPVVLLLIPVAWAILSLHGARNIADGGAIDGSIDGSIDGAIDAAIDVDGAGARAAVRSAKAALGPITTPERRTLMVFACVAAAWVLSAQLKKLPGLEGLNDQIIGLIGVIAFFALPSGAPGARSAPLLDWTTAEWIPWGVVLLFGGGLSLAAAIAKSGLAQFLAGYFVGLGAMPDVVVILALTVFVLTMTEFTSNVATVSALLPMVGAIALATGFDLVALAAPVGLAASCAFMLPMATGPNAVAYAAGGVSMGEMARVGVRVNIAGALLVTLIAAILG
ncbi:MAG: SLC13 family permease [Pseudomonadota bacterium]